MSRYLVLYRANASVWPVDPNQRLAVREGALAGGDELLRSGAAKEIGWFTVQEGYAIFEADSKPGKPRRAEQGRGQDPRSA